MKPNGKHWPHLGRRTMFGLAMIFTICFAGSSAFADSFPDLGLAGNFAVLNLGSSVSSQRSSLGIRDNTSKVVGNVGGGPGFIDFQTINATIDGTVFVQGSPNVPPPSITGTVTGGAPVVQNMTQIAADALNASMVAAGLTPTQIITTQLRNNTTITATNPNGLNVIRFTANDAVVLDNRTLTLVGGPNSQWVFQFTGGGSNPLEIKGNTRMDIGDINPANIIWSLAGNLPGVVTISGGGQLIGTILAPERNITVQGSNATVFGAIIGGGRNGGVVSVHSSGMVIFQERPAPPGVIPEPSTLGLLGTGLVGLACAARRRLRL